MVVYPLSAGAVPTAPLARAPAGTWARGTPVVVDFGAATTRVGVAGAAAPAAEFASVAARWRDRRSGAAAAAVGADIALDPAAPQNAKPTHDQGVLTNWDAVEQVLDYGFDRLGVDSVGRVDAPVAISEILAAPHAPRRHLQELLFEGYGVPSAALGIGALFAFRQNCGDDASGIVVDFGHEFTTIIPIVAGRPDLGNAKRISYGGRAAADFLQQQLALKYPTFPVRVTPAQTLQMIKEHCYVAQDYGVELAGFLQLDGLDARERIVQTPILGIGRGEKSAEELARIAERRQESGRRLQEQAARARAEKLAAQHAQLAALLAVDADSPRALRAAGLRSAAELEAAIAKLELAIRRADGGADAAVEAAPPEFPLADVPDAELDADGIREKRRQRLMRANYEARQRVKQEKLEEAQRLADEERRDADARAADLEEWVREKRAALDALQVRARERKRFKAELGDRKSYASKMRIQTMNALISGADPSSRKRGRGGGEVEDGETDEMYGEFLGETESDEEREAEEVTALQQKLLAHDPNFTLEDLETHKSPWHANAVHLFLYGAHPFNAEAPDQAHQLNLNVERIRVPEVLLQPSLAGIDQAGVGEIVADLLRHRYDAATAAAMARNVVLAGGLAALPGLAPRVLAEVRAALPAGTELGVRLASDPAADAWRGMAGWANTPQAQDAFVTRAEYEEHGAGWVKPHRWGNLF